MRSPLNRRATRWAAPVAVAGAIALGSWIPSVTASADTPNLPTLSAAQVLAKASHPNIKAFSGTVEMTANLGLPALSSVSGGDSQSTKSAAGFDPTTLLSGTHDINVWDNGADQQRLQLPSSLAETDFVHNGKDAYLYSSDSQTVTHLVPGAKDAASSAGAHGTDAAKGGADTPNGQVPMTPEQVAQRFLTHIDPSTTVKVDSPVFVVGRATYQLTLAPRAGTPAAAASTVSGVTMSVDSTTGMVLCVTVNARGATPALMVAFTNTTGNTFTTAAPAASNFAAPTGTTTKTETINGSGTGDHARNGHPQGSKPTVTGAPWAQVVTFPHVNLGKSAKELSSLTAPVPNSSARLLSTNVVNALVFPDGRVVAGFVTPGALEAAAGG
ncbi:MAG: hypothetical protein M3137_16885 [Actinomycetota bacterium]|nr:hypothetical protein [Actinomycetota bacterium]